MARTRGRHRKATPPAITVVRLLAAGGIAALVAFGIDSTITTVRMFPEVVAPASSTTPSVLTHFSLPPSVPETPLVTLPPATLPPPVVLTPATKYAVPPVVPTTTSDPPPPLPPKVSDQPDPGVSAPIGSAFKIVVPLPTAKSPLPKPQPPAPSPVGQFVAMATGHSSVLAAARTLVGSGIPYVYGGKDLGGLDCSGFVWWVLKKVGYSVPYRTSDGLQAWATPITAAAAVPGDLVFWPGHVGIYAGPGIVVDDGTAAGPKQSTIWGSPSYGRIPL